MASSKVVNLYGGAINATLPSNFVDASNFRQVPDHQEVFLDPNGPTTIIVELNERVNDGDHAFDDDKALKYHFEDVASDGDDNTKLQPSSVATLPNLPQASARSLIATQHPRLATNTRHDVPEFTAILMTLIRLAEQKTDILISINIPHFTQGNELEHINIDNEKLGSLISTGLKYQDQLLKSFNIINWDIFC